MRSRNEPDWKLQRFRERVHGKVLPVLPPSVFGRATFGWSCPDVANENVLAASNHSLRDIASTAPTSGPGVRRLKLVLLWRQAGMIPTN